MHHCFAAEAEVNVSVIKGQEGAGIRFTAQHGGSSDGDTINEVRLRFLFSFLKCV